MKLAAAVSRPPARGSDKPSKPRVAGPFGGMNLREARVREHSRPAPNKSQSTRGRQNATSKRSPSSGFKALKMHRALAQVPYGERSTVKTRISSIESFEDLPLLPAVRDSVFNQALSGLSHISPTAIQRLAIPALVKSYEPQSNPESSRPPMKQYLLAAETGSGKTLAYLLPAIDAIKRTETAEEEVKKQESLVEDKKPRSIYEVEAPLLSSEADNAPRPRAIVLLPTSELVSQVGGVGKLLAHTVKYRAALISSAYSPRVIRSRLSSPGGVDILFATPHLLASIADVDPNILSRVTHLIVDEADSLLDRSFAPLTSAILDRATPSLRQLVLCSATIPRSLDSYMRHRFPDMERLVTPNLHAIPRRVQLGVVDIDKEPYRGNKNLACADTIWTIGRSAAEHAETHGEYEKEKVEVKRIIVFVNEREKAQEVADYLISKGINASALSRDTPEHRQSEVLSFFTSTSAEDDSTKSTLENSISNPPPGSRKTAAAPRRSLPNTRVLVMTDLGSRGIDTIAVRHVILYDVPHTTIDFIHRLGRTGRMGKRGRGIVLVGKHDRKDIVREVREGMYRGQALI
ncbi:MAG: RNA helicase [Watsoniomyces obsoletus]|nr:MAG: RNA helicase [Watsoniomyces obsoletus]